MTWTLTFSHWLQLSRRRKRRGYAFIAKSTGIVKGSITLIHVFHC